jgi:hypothetical protein
MYASPSVVTSQRYFAVAAALLGLAVAGTWFSNRHLSQQELLALPSQQRHALYVHTLETLETVCMHAQAPDLRGYCREQAQFIVGLPECGASCQEVCRRLAPRPTK